MKRILLTTILMLLALPIFSQPTEYKGNVKDADGTPIVGATAVIKGTVKGTLTNAEGDFRMVASPGDTLVVSCLGYVEKAEVLSGRTELAFVLMQESLTMDDVVVVGYGTQKKVSVTGAISSVDDKRISSVPVASATNALAGNVSGITVVRSTGRPGSDAGVINIRGMGTFNDSSPLVLVDGIERDFSLLDPEEIQTISVLKDASATAIYGVRGANGVILVTTKRGAENKLRVNLTAEIGFTEVIGLQKRGGVYESAILQNESLKNDGTLPVWTAYDLERFRLGDSQQTHFTGAEHTYDLFCKGLQQKYNLSISGGNRKVRYYVAAGYYDQGGNYQTDLEKIWSLPYMQALFDQNPSIREKIPNRNYDPETNFRRFSLRGNTDIALSKRSSVSLDVSYISTTMAGAVNDNRDRFCGLIQGNFGFSWLTPVGLGAVGLRQDNPILNVNYRGYNISYNTRFESTLNYKLDLDDLVEGLSFRTKMAFDMYWNSFSKLSVGAGAYNYNRETKKYALQNATYYSPNYSSGQGAARGKQYVEAAFSYNRGFGDHHLSGILLVNFSSNRQPSTAQSVYGNIPQIYQGIVGRINYDYANKYLFEVNAGYNGSNRFAKGRRYAFFPATSIGWVISEENFLKESEFISFLKLRASVGQVGNDKMGSFNYYYDDLWASDGGNFQGNYHFGNDNPISYPIKIETRIGNDNITWERATKYNAGLETKWFGKLSLSGDYFYEYRKDIIRPTSSVPVVSGIIATSPSNIGIIENQGYELEAKWNDRIGGLRYYANLMYSFARNKIIENGAVPAEYEYQDQRGRSMGLSYLYQFTGVFGSWEEIGASPYQGDALPGSARFLDANRDGVINEYDKVPVGYPRIPEITYSGRFGFDWKGLDFSIMFQGAANTSRIPEDTYNNGAEVKRLARGYQLDSWTPEHGGSSPLISASRSRLGTKLKGSTFFLLDGSYLRLKNLTVGYTLPKKWTKKMNISSIRFYMSGFNIATWGPNVDVMDPEATWDYLPTKAYTWGVNINF